MRKYTILLLSSLLSIVLLSIFLMRPMLSHTGFAAAILSLTGLQSATSSPQTDSIATTTLSIIDVLQNLQDQEQRLTGEMLDLRAQLEGMRLKDVFVRILKRGDSGDDVKTLQTLLPDVSSAVATSTTGFYGGITEKSVNDFQESVGLKGTGIFDMESRDALISLVQSKISTEATSTDFNPIDLSTVSDPQQNVQNLQDQIVQLTSELSSDETTISDLQSRITSLESNFSDIQSNVTALSSNVTTLSSVSSTPAPVVQPLAISNIQVGSITKTSVTITWTTNNPATSEVDYSTNSSMPVSQTLIAKSSTQTTNHSTVLTALTLGTTYYYHIISQDSSTTFANSSNLHFTTALH